MYDFWFSLGAAIMDPTLINVVNAAGPVFNRVTREIIETDSTGAVTFQETNTLTAGLIDVTATTTVRGAIASFTQSNPAAPPVSVYTAGKWCQLVAVTTINFAQDIGLANQAYVASLGANQTTTFSSRFPAFLGVCLIDGGMVSRLLNPAASPDLPEALAEFGISSDPTSIERTTISAFVANTNFQTASGNLLNSPGTPWDFGCLDQFFFWAGENERAII